MNKQNQKLQARITKLKRDKELLRLYLHELVESFYKVVNGERKEKPSFSQDQTETSNSEVFNSDLEALFKGFREIIKSCSNCSSKTDFEFSTFNSANQNKSNWEQIKDIFAKMKNEVLSETKGENNE